MGAPARTRRSRADLTGTVISSRHLFGSHVSICKVGVARVAIRPVFPMPAIFAADAMTKRIRRAFAKCGRRVALHHPFVDSKTAAPTYTTLRRPIELIRVTLESVPRVAMSASDMISRHRKSTASGLGNQRIALPNGRFALARSSAAHQAQQRVTHGSTPRSSDVGTADARINSPALNGRRPSERGRYTASPRRISKPLRAQIAGRFATPSDHI
jgi:hypothetical protein